MSNRILLAALFVSIGTILILAVPKPYEGPMLIFLSDEHAIRLVDAIGLALAIPSWFYLNWTVFHFLSKWWKSKL